MRELIRHMPGMIMFVIVAMKYYDIFLCVHINFALYIIISLIVVATEVAMQVLNNCTEAIFDRNNPRSSGYTVRYQYEFIEDLGEPGMTF